MKVIWYKKLALFLVLLTILVTTACASGGTPVAQAPTQQKPVSGEPAATESGSVAAEGFNWKRFDGTKIKVYVADTGQMAFVQPKLAEFTDLTGI